MFGKACTLSEAQIEAKAEELLGKMTLKEKVFLLSGNWQMFRDSIVYKRTYNPVPITSHGLKRLKIKPIAFTDGPRGVVMGHSTCFPVSMARAASFDRGLEREIGEAVTVTTTVKNVGERAGVEIVQVYVSVPDSAVERHVKELKGFARVPLAAGEEKNVEIKVPLEELKYYNEETNTWVLESTGYDFLVGPNAGLEALKKVSVRL